MSRLTPALCRAARGLLDWTQADLSKAAGLSTVSIRAFEKGGTIREKNRRALLRVFETAGVEFLSESNRGGPGLRLRKVGASED
jgi:DNA-binding XRE family transcriptional regulator